ncbi:hypothetical protein CEP78_008875 [Helicobacter pylori]|nr:hypothetical protein CEP78_008875 [Helicobacter pylori]
MKILIITGNPPYSGASENKGLLNGSESPYGIDPKFQTIEIEKMLTCRKIQTLLSSVQSKSKAAAKTI